jgi:tRNA(Ile)-lysidine synthase
MQSKTLYEKFQHNINCLLQEVIGDILPLKIAVAVSGGADSIALLMMTSIFASAHNVEVTVVTVNHHLRKEAEEEIKYVRDLSNKLGHTCFILDWDPQDNFSNLQARARDGRYKLMTDLCKYLDILVLLTAHHQDDYIESFCLRKARKSSFFGLSSSNRHYTSDILLLRPLFNVHKIELIKYLEINGVLWFEDQSNYNDKYQRNLLRKALRHDGQEIQDDILTDLSEINQKASIHRTELISAIASVASIYRFGFAKISRKDFCLLSQLIKVQLINFILLMVSGKTKIPRGDSTKFLLSMIEKGQDFTVTLHNCCIKTIEGKLLVYRELGRHLPADIKLARHAIWDNRFRVENEINIQNAYLSSMKMEDYQHIKDDLRLEELKILTYNHHKTILFTLPVIKVLEKVISLPHISYYDQHYQTCETKINISYRSAFISRFTHFL